MKHNIILFASTRSGLSFKRTHLAVCLKKQGHQVIVISNKKAQTNNLFKILIKNNIKYLINKNFDLTHKNNYYENHIYLKNIINNIKNEVILQGEGLRYPLRVYPNKFLLKTKKINIITTAGFLPDSSIQLFGSSILNRLCTDKIISLCDYTKNKLISHGLPHSKTTVIPINGPRLDWFDKAKISSNNNIKKYLPNIDEINRPIILYAAHHYPWKGFEYFLMAAKKVLKKRSATFIIGGDGPHRQKLEFFTKSLGFNKNIVFTGLIDPNDMPYVLHNIPSICVSSSLVEQFSAYLLECMAAKKPIIATRVGGTQEAIRSGIEGYLVPPRDVDSLASKIIELIDNPEKAISMGKKGRKRIEQDFSMEIGASKLGHLYDSLF